MKIICPTDFMPHTKSALSFAMSIAKLLDAELHIITVYSLSSYDEQSNKLREKAQKEKTKELANLVLNSQISHKVKPPTLFAIFGNPKKSILEYADEIGADLIVMGTQGNSNLSNTFLGSVAKAVVNGSRVPVFVIPEKFSYYRYPTKMLLALDNKILENESSFDIPLALAKIWNSKIDIIHVMKKDEHDFPFDPFATTFLKDRLGDIHIPEDDNIVFGLLKFVADKDFDILIMVKREKGFLEKIFNKDHIKGELKRSLVPVLIVQE